MMRLYDNLSSGNAYKVRLLLHQLGREFERIEKDIDRNLERVGTLDERAQSLDSPSPLLPARKTAEQVRAEAAPKAADSSRAREPESRPGSFDRQNPYRD